MGRKNLSEVRREEILRAFARSVALHGFDVPLEIVASESGIARSLIRHHAGNREALVDALIDRVSRVYAKEVGEALQAVAATGDINAFLDLILDTEGRYSDWDRVLGRLLSSRETNQIRAREAAEQTISDLVASIRNALVVLCPGAADTQYDAISYGLFCLVTTHELLGWAGATPARDELVRRTARALIESTRRET